MKWGGKTQTGRVMLNNNGGQIVCVMLRYCRSKSISIGKLVMMTAAFLQGDAAFSLVSMVLQGPPAGLRILSSARLVLCFIRSHQDTMSEVAKMQS